jgi:hypothetical protein
MIVLLYICLLHYLVKLKEKSTVGLLQRQRASLAGIEKSDNARTLTHS